MDDIVPGLLEQIQSAFDRNIADDEVAQEIHEKIVKGSATYADAQEYACQIGEALSKSLQANLRSGVLPDGTMYYNIADRVLRPMLESDHKVISEAAQMVQTSLNQAAGLGMKAQAAPLDTDRIDGLVNKISGKPIDDVMWLLGEPIINFSQNIVDETIRQNVDFQGRAGLRPKVIRKAERKCCSWCRNLAGEYDYPDIPHDVYRRHENCRCVVEYDPGDGRRQNVHTKRWTSQGERDMIEERKRLGLSNTDIFQPRSYQDVIDRYVELDRPAIVDAAEKGKRHAGVYDDASNKTRKQLAKSIVSRTSQVERHADKIKDPTAYVKDWEMLTPDQRSGLLRKWEKDMRRNAEQAEIELYVFEKRFGQ